MVAPKADDPVRRFQRRLHKRYALYTLGVIAFIGAMAMAERAGMSRTGIGSCFLFGTVLVYAVIGLMSRTTNESEYYVAGRRVPAVYNGMATAADWMSAASFIGTAGVLYLQGFAGFAYILGWTGGYCLVALLLAPYLRRFGRFTISDFLAARYGGSAPRLIGVAATVLVCFVYVVVQVYGVGLITSHLTGLSFELGIFIGLGGVLVCSFLGGMRAVTWTQVAQYIVLIIAYSVPVVWLGLQQTGSWAPMFSYGEQLRAVTAREDALRVDPKELEVRAILSQRAEAYQLRLQDVPMAMLRDSAEATAEVAQLRADNAPLVSIQQAQRRLERLPRDPVQAKELYQRERDAALAQARPLAGLAPQALAHPEPTGGAAGPGTGRRNFLALVFCLMLGTAAMPHVLTRYYTTASVADTRRSVAWSLFFIVLLYLSAPALAVMVKYEVLNHLVGSSFANLPEWTRRWAKLDPSLISLQDINHDGTVQLAELYLGGDMIVLAAPEMGGLPLVVTYLVAAGGLAAALSTADGLLLTMSNAVSHDFFFRYLERRSTPARRVMLSKLMVLVVAVLAAWAASARVTDILPFVTAAFSLAAAAFFPALVMGIFWRRANRQGAVAGMLSGLGVCAWYMVNGMAGPRAWLGLHSPAADARWLGIDPMAAGVFGVPAGLLALVVVSLLTRPPDGAEAEMAASLRRPPTSGGP